MHVYDCKVNIPIGAAEAEYSQTAPFRLHPPVVRELVEKVVQDLNGDTGLCAVVPCEVKAVT